MSKSPEDYCVCSRIRNRCFLPRHQYPECRRRAQGPELNKMVDEAAKPLHGYFKYLIAIFLYSRPFLLRACLPACLLSVQSLITGHVMTTRERI